MGRMGSTLLYLLTAVVTCAAACRIQLAAKGEALWVGGQRTRRSFQNRLYITGIFVILFLLMAIRFDIGNDYRQYTQTAHEAYVGGYVVTEIGFNWLVRVLYWVAGGEYYELVFAVFAFVTLLFFLRAFARQSVDFSQTFFLFMTFGLYFQTFNTVRYYLALAIALYSMKYVLEKNYISFVFWILTASLFHKSVLLVIPVYWICTFLWKGWHIIAGLLACTVCFLGKGLVLKLALVLYPSYKNTVYLEEGSSLVSGLRILAVMGLYLWFIVYTGERIREKEWYRELRFYGQLNLLAFAASTFFSFLPVVTRIAYYFGISQLFMIPLIIKNIEDERIWKRVTMIIFCVCIVYFLVFLLRAHQEGVGLLPYKSWLFEPQRYTYK
ncbi:MAG: EpsG family protein [Lachnospiraceae bacterium]|nr:EpsG family protein [Lachnospiraceae bacterium]